MEPIRTLPVALALALVHVALPLLRPRLAARPRSKWLSVAGGIAVAFTTLHDFPSIASSTHRHGPEATAGLQKLHEHIYLAALTGFVVYYALGRLPASVRREHATRVSPHAGVAVVANVLLNGSIGLVLAGHVRDWIDLTLFAVAMTGTVVVLDSDLQSANGRLWDRSMRWIASASLLAGWDAGALGSAPEPFVASTRAFIVGAVSISVFRAEMRDDAEASVPAFTIAVAVFTGLCVVLLEFH